MVLRVALIVAFIVALLCSVSRAGNAPKSLAFTVIGDWGVPKVGSEFTDQIAQISTAKKCQFTVALGDNFYKGVSIHPNGGGHHGVKGTNDPKWKSVWIDQFKQKFFQKPWYVIVGNHDYDGDEMAQVQYAKQQKQKRWKLPSLYYHFTKKLAKGITVQFFMLDSMVLTSTDSHLKEYGRSKDIKQLQWLQTELKKSKATWRLVFAHHPIYTSKGKKAYLIKNLVPMMERYKVATFVNGHVHTFDHVKSKKIDYFTVGSTGIQDTIPSKNVAGITHKFTYPTQTQIDNGLCPEDSCRGFAIMTVSGRKHLILQFYNTKGQPVYTTFKIKNPNKKR